MDLEPPGKNLPLKYFPPPPPKKKRPLIYGLSMDYSYILTNELDFYIENLNYMKIL